MAGAHENGEEHQAAARQPHAEEVQLVEERIHGERPHAHAEKGPHQVEARDVGLAVLPPVAAVVQVEAEDEGEVHCDEHDVLRVERGDAAVRVVDECDLLEGEHLEQDLEVVLYAVPACVLPVWVEGGQHEAGDFHDPDERHAKQESGYATQKHVADQAVVARFQVVGGVKGEAPLACHGQTGLLKDLVEGDVHKDPLPSLVYNVNLEGGHKVWEVEGK